MAGFETSNQGREKGRKIMKLGEEGESGSPEWMIELCRGGISREWPEGKGKRAEETSAMLMVRCNPPVAPGTGRTENVKGPEL